MKPLPIAIIRAMSEINKTQGPGSIMVLGRHAEEFKIERLSTGIKDLDDILDGGLPKSSLVELFGEFQSGKTTLATIIGAAVQRAGGTVAYMDAENSYDRLWAKRYGLDHDSLIFSQPDTAEDAMNIALRLITANIDLIIVDTVYAMVPRAEAEEEEEDRQSYNKSQRALLARVMSKACRLLVRALKKKNTIMIFINQFTTDVNANAMFGIPLKTKGGLALKQYARVRLEVAIREFVTDKALEKRDTRDSTVPTIRKGRIGQVVQVRVVKSKVSAPHQQCQFKLHYYSRQQLERLHAKG